MVVGARVVAWIDGLGLGRGMFCGRAGIGRFG